MNQLNRPLKILLGLLLAGILSLFTLPAVHAGATGYASYGSVHIPVLKKTLPKGVLEHSIIGNGRKALSQRGTVISNQICYGKIDFVDKGYKEKVLRINSGKVEWSCKNVRWTGNQRINVTYSNATTLSCANLRINGIQRAEQCHQIH